MGKGAAAPRRSFFAMDKFEDSMVYSTNATVNYADKRLFFLWLTVSMIFPIYVLYGAAVNGEYQGQVETEYYFTVDSANSIININDLIADTQTGAEIGSLAIEEADDTILIPSMITSAFQEEGLCAMDDLNPGIACKEDITCQRHYNQPQATCDQTTQTCIYQPYQTWCTKRIEKSNLYDVKEMLDLKAIARVMCDGHVFSNYDLHNEANSRFFNLNTIDLLEMSPLPTNDNYREYFDVGAGLAVHYEWRCNLDNKNLGETDCPFKLSVEVLAQNAFISRDNIVVLSSATNGDGEKATRIKQSITGFRFRFRGLGGCYQTTSISVLDLLTRGFAVDSLVAIFMGIVLYLWHKRYHVARAEDTFRIIPGRDGAPPTAKLFSPEPLPPPDMSKTPILTKIRKHLSQRSLRLTELSSNGFGFSSRFAGRGGRGTGRHGHHPSMDGMLDNSTTAKATSGEFDAGEDGSYDGYGVSDYEGDEDDDRGSSPRRAGGPTSPPAPPLGYIYGLTSENHHPLATPPPPPPHPPRRPPAQPASYRAPPRSGQMQEDYDDDEDGYMIGDDQL